MSMLTWIDLFYRVLGGVLILLELMFYSSFLQNTTKLFVIKENKLTFFIFFSVAIFFSYVGPFWILYEMLLLFLYGKLVLRQATALSAATAVLSVAVLELTTGLFGIISALIFTKVFPCFFSPKASFQPLVEICVNAVALITGVGILLMLAGAYLLILRRFHPARTPDKPYMAVLLFPLLLVLLVTELITGTIYTNTTTIDSATGTVYPQVNDWQMLLIYLVACGCLCAVLYACRRLADSAAAQTKLALLEQQARAQENYVREARSRYERTKSFRHDIQSHLQVLEGLLKKGNTSEAGAYLEKLAEASGTLSFPCVTGNPVVDTLLGSKLGLAREKGIAVDCAVQIPGNCAVEDMDLCVVLGNAVDNAINACLAVAGERWIRLSSRRKGNFIPLEIENICLSDISVKEGIGIANIRAAAHKYRGTVQMEVGEGIFRLSILLVIS